MMRIGSGEERKEEKEKYFWSRDRGPAPSFLSAAKPTDQGEESVVLLLVVVVVVGGGTIFKCPMYSFLRCEK